MNDRTTQDARIARMVNGASASSPARSRVWILEDSPLEAEVAARALAPGFDVEAFGEGVALVERLAAGDEPDVLVLDWHLPGLSGLDVLQFVRQTRDEVTLPVLMVTAARSDVPDVVDALRAGANDFVAKPYPPEVLRARVQTLARVRALHERARVAEAEGHRRRAFEQQLIGIVSHDLRNPLAAVAMSAAMLTARPVVDERQRTTIARIVASTARAIRLIEDLLDFTRVRAGGVIPLEPTDVDLHALAAQIVDEVLVSRPERQVALRAEGDGRGVWDADRVAQVVQNLVANALQHTTEDAPVSVRTRGEPEHVVFEVHNGGPSIAGDDLARLFEPFQRGHGTSAGGRSMGLGLFITAHIVRAHGGTVEARSTADDGTTFTVRLPRRLPPELASAATERPAE